MRTHQHTNDTKTAIGYVRVSTQEQATEGVSLDAQRDKLRAYCRPHGIKLIDIKADEGISGSTLEWPVLQAALQMLRRGRANTLLVAKLDRLSRSLRDVCTLVDELFSDERYHLLSLCGMVNTHSAAGRMVLMNLANYNQFEREMIAERTRDALQHMKAQGVRLGPAPYGYELSHEVDDKGRRVLVPLASEQEVLRKIEALRADGSSLRDIARRLNEVNIPARRDGTWRPQRISIVLQRSGKHTVRLTKKPGSRIPLRYDREAATARAKELRAQGLSLSKIGLGRLPDQDVEQGDDNQFGAGDDLRAHSGRATCAYKQSILAEGLDQGAGWRWCAADAVPPWATGCDACDATASACSRTSVERRGRTGWAR